MLPELAQAPATDVLPELPQEPDVRKFYMYKGRKVVCMSRVGCDLCVRYNDYFGDCPDILCAGSKRKDRKSVQFVPVD